MVTTEAVEVVAVTSVASLRGGVVVVVVVIEGCMGTKRGGTGIGNRCFLLEECDVTGDGEGEAEWVGECDGESDEDGEWKGDLDGDRTGELTMPPPSPPPPPLSLPPPILFPPPGESDRVRPADCRRMRFFLSILSSLSIV